MLNMNCGVDTIYTKRRRPNKTAIYMLGVSRVHWLHALSWLVPSSAIVYRDRVSTSLTSAHHTYLSTLIL